MRDCGLNAVQTYVPWNVHQPSPGGGLTFEGAANLPLFLRLANEAGLLVVLRPGPYACAEWEWGGFPWWLASPDGPLLNGTGGAAAEARLQLRTSEPRFLAAAEAWLRAVLPAVRPFLYSSGGPVIMSQVENEYGTYGSDRAYLERLRDVTAELLPTVIVHSTDTPSARSFEATDIPGVFQTVDFGSEWNASDAFAVQRRFEPDGPLYNSEYYTGWLTHWNESSLQARPAALIAGKLDEILSYRNASVNMYMFVGSSNFGFMNGANLALAAPDDPYAPVITSYDYDSPVRENGTVGIKYAAVCAVVQRHTGLGSPARVAAAAAAAAAATPPMAPRRLTADRAASLWDALPAVAGPARGPGLADPPTFEESGQAYGMALHTAPVRGPSGSVGVAWLRDRVTIYVNRREAGSLSRTNAGPVPGQVPVALDACGSDGTAACELAVLVENLGRVNFGPFLNGAGAGVRGVAVGQQYVSNWTSRALPLASVTAAQLAPLLAPSAGVAAGPAFYVVAGFTADASPAGKVWTSLSLPSGWTKGSVFVNGFNVGRYWNAVGPQYELHVPQSALLPGEGANSVVVFELHGPPAFPATVLLRQVSY